MPATERDTESRSRLLPGSLTWTSTNFCAARRASAPAPPRLRRGAEMTDRLLIAWSLIALLARLMAAFAWMVATQERRKLRRERRAETRRRSRGASRGILR